MLAESKLLYPPYGFSVFRKVAWSRGLSFENKATVDVIKSFFDSEAT